LNDSTIPAISGNKLISLLKKDGWEEKRRVTHGVALAKRLGDRTRVAVVPSKSSSLPTGTLMAILSYKQTGIGKAGLLTLIKKYR
jgi:predicted RNA binding protein YcfA (HicA-like mRNA interferase family)